MRGSLVISFLALALCSSLSAQESTATQKEVQRLRDSIAAQEQQIESLRQQLNQLENSLQAKPAEAQAQPPQAQQVAPAANLENPAEPTSIHYKGVTLTPGGFFAAETAWRQRGLLSDVNTPFNSIPFGGSDQAHISDFFASARQSRISLLVQGKLSSVKLTGFYELDWLSAGVTSNNNESNSYTNRQRQIWGQAAFNNGWSFTGGQMWSLVTETKTGLDNRTETLPMTIDAQYHVGFSWARQFGVRVVKNLNNKAWLGVSLENPQTIFAAHGNANNFLLGGPGTGGGLYNLNSNYSFNSAPDVIVKAALEPGWGHYEVFGILSQFHDRVYPNAVNATPSSLGAYNDNRTGGGFGANARGTVLHHVDLGIHLLAGDGVGRYGTSTLPDATVRPDGTLALLRAYQLLGTLEWHSKHWDWYTNYGTEYAQRAWFLNSAGKPVGYGSPLFSNAGCSIEAAPAGSFAPAGAANCTGDTRSITEATVGFWYKFYNGSRGRVQWGPQYSYVIRNAWSGTGGQPRTTENMLFTSFRYYLP